MSKSNGYIKLNYYGGYGNQLFIYFMARLYGEKHNLTLITELKNNYIKLKKNFIDENIHCRTDNVMYHDDSNLHLNKTGVYKIQPIEVNRS